MAIVSCDEVVVACASHVDSPARRACLLRQLHSLRAQTAPLRCFLSVSGDHAPASYPEGVVVCREDDGRLSQFEHYKRLVLGPLTRVRWLMFVDDDDFCHPRRNQLYLEQIARASECEHVYCRGAQLEVVGADAHRLRYEELEAVACSDRGRVTDGAREYYCFAVRVERMRSFLESIERVDPAAPKYSACDLLFRAYLSRLPCRVFEAQTWVYAKTMSPSVLDHASLELDFWAINVPWCKRVWERVMSDSIAVRPQGAVTIADGPPGRAPRHDNVLRLRDET